MNKNLFYLLLLSIVFSACKDSNNSEPERLEINKLSFTFDEKENTDYFSITSNLQWTTTASDNTWLECTPSSGEGNYSVRVKVSANNSRNARNGTITINTPSKITKTIEVTQAGQDPYITVQPESIEALSTGEELTIQVSASNEWDIRIPENAQGWISVESTATANVVFSIIPNDTKDKRSAEIVFQLNGEELYTTLELSQNPINNGLDIEPAKAGVSDGAEQITVNVTTDINWVVVIPETDTWVKVKEQTKNQVLFTVEENMTGATRTANISFQSESGDKITNFELTQIKGYALMTTMNPEIIQAGLSYDALNTFVKNYGFDYTEHPHCTGGYGGHSDGVHFLVEKDAFLDKHVFRFDIHITPVIDGDRCNSSTTDRQRNELKSATNNSSWAKVQGNWNEWQRIEWKFKIPAGFQPTGSFCHIHQLKAQDGPNNGSPVITITPRANSDGSNKRMQIIHSVDGANTGKGRVVDNIPLFEFEDEWVQVQEDMHYTHNGFYSIKITRIRDNKVLLRYTDDNIDMWRKGATYIRSKYGIYRSLAGGDLSKDPVGQSPLLKNESIWMCDFKIWEKNTNPNPGMPK